MTINRNEKGQNLEENVESFFERIKPVFTPKEERLIRLAYVISKAGHRNQWRKENDSNGNPIRYFNHPRNVAIILLDEHKTTSKDMVISALLHDGLEDIRGLTADMIEEYFGTEVCKIVKLLTKDPKEGYWERLEAANNVEAILVKTADRLDNLRSMEKLSIDFKIKQLKETATKVFPLHNNLYKNQRSSNMFVNFQTEFTKHCDLLGIDPKKILEE